jgi:hypothetical protein
MVSVEDKDSISLPGQTTARALPPSNAKRIKTGGGEFPHLLLLILGSYTIKSRFWYLLAVKS